MFDLAELYQTINLRVYVRKLAPLVRRTYRLKLAQVVKWRPLLTQGAI